MKKISIVVPCYNEQDVIELFYAELLSVIRKLPYEFEVIFVDDGSIDGTWGKVIELKPVDNIVVCGKKLLINVGHALALQAGYEMSSGDAVISMDADLQHPPIILIEFLRKWENGCRLVKGIRTSTDGVGPFKRITSEVFYKAINKYSSLNLVIGEADFRLVDRTILDIVNKMPESPKFYRGIFSVFNVKSETVPFVAPPRAAGNSKYNLPKMFELSRLAFVSFSDYPLRAIFVLGSGVASLSLFGLFISVLLKIFYGYKFVSNIILIGLFISVLTGVLISINGVLSLYFIDFARQLRGRPPYLVDVIYCSKSPFAQS